MSVFEESKFEETILQIFSSIDFDQEFQKLNESELKSKVAKPNYGVHKKRMNVKKHTKESIHSNTYLEQMSKNYNNGYIKKRKN